MVVTKQADPQAPFPHQPKLHTDPFSNAEFLPTYDKRVKRDK